MRKFFSVIRRQIKQKNEVIREKNCIIATNIGNNMNCEKITLVLKEVGMRHQIFMHCKSICTIKTIKLF